MPAMRQTDQMCFAYLFCCLMIEAVPRRIAQPRELAERNAELSTRSVALV